MATVTVSLDVRLTEAEREALDLGLERLAAELGMRLRAVWLYGSRARGEDTGWESDVDLLVIVDPGTDGDDELVRGLIRGDEELAAENPGGLSLPWALSVWTWSLDWLASRRAIGDFFIGEVDREKVVLIGGALEEERPRLVAGERWGGRGVAGVVDADGVVRDEETGMRARSAEFLRQARQDLADAREVFAQTSSAGGTVMLAYVAMLNAARAALSEADRFSRTHSGVWGQFSQVYVKSVRFDAGLYASAAAMRERREHATYGPSDAARARGAALFVSDEEAAETLAIAEDFVPAVERLLGRGAS